MGRGDGLKNQPDSNIGPRGLSSKPRPAACVFVVGDVSVAGGDVSRKCATAAQVVAERAASLDNPYSLPPSAGRVDDDRGPDDPIR